MNDNHDIERQLRTATKRRQEGEGEPEPVTEDAGGGVAMEVGVSCLGWERTTLAGSTRWVSW